MSQVMLMTALTLAAYAAARSLCAHRPSPLTNPVVTATPCIVVMLLVSGTDYPIYRDGARWVSALLGPAVVALAVPLYKHRGILRRYALSACVGMLCGALAALLASVALAKALDLSEALTPALGIKSATAPIAVQLGPIVGADPGICAVFAIATGMIGAVLGPFVLNGLRILDPVARGLAYGSISHGIGTSQATAEGELQGAVSGVAMGCSAVLVAVAAPHVLQVLV